MILRMLIAIIVTVFAGSGRAQVVEFTNKQLWQAAVAGNYTAIDFTGFPNQTFITDQFANLGVVFLTVNYIAGPTPGFPNDDWGLIGPNGVRFRFSSPQNSVAVDYPGGVKFQLVSGGQLVYTSTFFAPGGTGNFAGLVSNVIFDEVYLFKPSGFENVLFIDDLYFGPPIPGPGALGVFAVAAAVVTRRRRRE